MAVFTALAAAAAVGGLALSAVSTIQQQKASSEQAKMSAAAIAEQKKAEAFRRQQMDLDATRRRREIVRSQIAALGTAEAVATNQGAQFGSGLPGAYGGISGRSGVNELGVNQNQEIGGNIFDSNAKVSDLYRQSALAGGSAATWAGLSSLGGMMIQNNETIGKVGSYFMPKQA